MIISTEINTLEMIILSAGTPFLFSLAKMEGKSLSREIAAGICPCTNIQPFKAPNVDMIAPIATKFFAHGPQIMDAASEKGALEY